MAKKTAAAAALDWHQVANRLYFSSLYSVVYGVMIVLNLLIIVWMLRTPGGYDGSVTFLLLQVLVNLVLVIEVVIRLISQQERFFRHWSNIVDVCVMTLAICAQFLYLHPPEYAAAAITTEEWTDIAASAFRIARDGVLFARLYIFLKNHGKNLPVDEVDLALMGGDDDDDDGNNFDMEGNLQFAYSGAFGSSSSSSCGGGGGGGGVPLLADEIKRKQRRKVPFSQRVRAQHRGGSDNIV